MADNVTLNPGRDGEVVATDDIGGKHHQRVKIQHGAAGSATDTSVSTPLPIDNYSLNVAKALVTGHAIEHKFGHNDAVSNTVFSPVTIGGVYPTPQVSGATTVRIKAGGNANDTAAGSGAREVTVFGLDATGAEVSEAITTAGASASASTSQAFLRIFRAYVTASGTYATFTVGSHDASIVIEDTAGTEDWLTIDGTIIGRGQSGIAFITVPLGKTAYIIGGNRNVDSTKVASVLAFRRENILETAPPYTALRELFEIDGESGPAPFERKYPIRLPELTDFGFVAKMGAGTGDVSVNFEYILVDN